MFKSKNDETTNFDTNPKLHILFQFLHTVYFVIVIHPRKSDFLCIRTRTQMRTIRLNIPDNRCTDEWWNRCSEESLAIALESIGTILSMNGQMDTAEQIKQLQQQLEGANYAAQSAAHATNQRIEEMWTQRLQEKEQMVALLQGQCANFKMMLEQAHNACEAQQKNTERLVSSIQVHNTAPQCTAQQLGGIAESEIEQLIVDTLICEVQDTSHQSGYGDRFITTPDGLRLMLECKNVERLHSKQDIEKFRRDVYNGIQSQRINAALLISLKTTSIPNISGACSVQFMNGEHGRVPVVMLASNSKIAIQLAAHAVAQLQLIADKETLARGGTIPFELEALEKERDSLQKTLPLVFKCIHENESHIESRIEMLQRLLDDANTERTRHKEVVYQIMKIQQTVSWIGASQEENDQDLAISIVLKWFERKQEFPKTSEMTIPQRTAIRNAGGLKTVIDLAKKRQRITGD